MRWRPPTGSITTVSAGRVVTDYSDFRVA